MSGLKALSPAPLWHWFEQICAIPHPSHHEAALAQYIFQRAQQAGLAAQGDDAGNLLIRKPATAGYETRTPIALQAHLDMVPQANAETQHDFTRDPIVPYVDGDWVRARGTTLGADNGIGLASCLAVLFSDDLAHPALEVLLTVTEETGMVGANNLKANWLTAPVLINTDTEEFGEVYIGCAGGEDANVAMPIRWQATTGDRALRLTLKGLRGGHSGVDIHTNRLNANKTLFHTLFALQQAVPFQLAHVSGGSVRNAIPREASAELVYAAQDHDAMLRWLTQEAAQLQTDFALAEPNLTLDITEIALPARSLDSASSRAAIAFFASLPNGVTRYSDVVTDTVETSLSLGVMSTTENAIEGTILTRSLNSRGQDFLVNQLTALAELAGAQVSFAGRYPGWNPDPNSAITPVVKTLYDALLRGGSLPNAPREAKLKVIHAGLECGLFKRVYPQMDMVSIGPTINNAHSPDECVHIPSVAGYWTLLTQILAHQGE